MNGGLCSSLGVFLLLPRVCSRSTLPTVQPGSYAPSAFGIARHKVFMKSLPFLKVALIAS
ncbi:MAG TPA: hypothetical protein DEA71_02470 [Nitrospira sp.]|nr:hypothetical protein [Nitrospira sp.]